MHTNEVLIGMEQSYEYGNAVTYELSLVVWSAVPSGLGLSRVCYGTKCYRAVWWTRVVVWRENEDKGISGLLKRRRRYWAFILLLEAKLAGGALVQWFLGVTKSMHSESFSYNVGQVCWTDPWWQERVSPGDLVVNGADSASSTCQRETAVSRADVSYTNAC